jgi:hypothetical protein
MEHLGHAMNLPKGGLGDVDLTPLRLPSMGPAKN